MNLFGYPGNHHLLILVMARPHVHTEVYLYLAALLPNIPLYLLNHVSVNLLFNRWRLAPAPLPLARGNPAAFIELFAFAGRVEDDLGLSVPPADVVWFGRLFLVLIQLVVVIGVGEGVFVGLLVLYLFWPF
jgi:hypothetical protein